MAGMEVKKGNSVINIILTRVLDRIRVTLYNSSNTEVGTIANPIAMVGTVGSSSSITTNIHDSNGNDIDATSGRVHVDVKASVLPTGAATSAKQDTGNTSLSSIDTKLTISTDMEAGGLLVVGTTRVEATFTGTTKSIIVSADIANTGILYVGDSNVTSAGVSSIVQLLPGEAVTMDYDDNSNAVYVVADTAAQNFIKGALL